MLSYLVVVLASTLSAPLPPSVVAFWDMQRTLEESADVYSWVDAVRGYVLKQHNASNPVRLEQGDGVYGPRCAAFARGQRLVALRDTVPELARISGPSATVSVVAWVKLEAPLTTGSFVGGVWEEDNAARQYALFLDGTGGCPTNDGIVAHISAEGGPSPGQRYCRSRACGATALPLRAWHCIANVYNGSDIMAFLNGTLDAAGSGGGGSGGGGGGSSSGASDNPFAYPDAPAFPNGGIFTPPAGSGANLALVRDRLRALRCHVPCFVCASVLTLTRALPSRAGNRELTSSTREEGSDRRSCRTTLSGRSAALPWPTPRSLPLRFGRSASTQSRGCGAVINPNCTQSPEVPFRWHANGGP